PSRRPRPPTPHIPPAFRDPELSLPPDARLKRHLAPLALTDTRPLPLTLDTRVERRHRQAPRGVPQLAAKLLRRARVFPVAGAVAREVRPVVGDEGVGPQE